MENRSSYANNIWKAFNRLKGERKEWKRIKEMKRHRERENDRDEQKCPRIETETRQICTQRKRTNGKMKLERNKKITEFRGSLR